MKTKYKVSTLQQALEKERKSGKKIGFVPTMGALHEGHISLVQQAQKRVDIVVVSIFVNPTQFDNKQDLKKYPRTLPLDKKLLKAHGVNYVFAPSVEEVYPEKRKKKVKVDLNGLDEQMEGAFRPGHFAGVVQVVKRLLDIVQPDSLYMGQKDFQQFTIIQQMIHDLSIPTELIVCPIMREAHGLAMSSRNERLPENLRKRASIIYKTLKKAKRMMKDHTPSKIEKWALSNLAIDGFEPEYFTIADGHTLKKIKSFKGKKYLVACTAVWTGGVRLIDNIILLKTK